MPGLEGGGRYEAAMVANAMAIAIRELELGGGHAPRSRPCSANSTAALRRLAGAAPRLCQELRDGTVLENRPDELRTLLSKVVHARLAISNPDYPRTQLMGSAAAALHRR